MCGIAEVLINRGFTVTGSDLAESEATQRLISLGARIWYQHSEENVSDADVVVFSSAVRPENIEVRRAREQGIPTIPRSEMLAELMRLKTGIAISGTHGKTTTTSMTGEILSKADLSPTIIVGGKVRSLGTGAAIGEGELLVAEADEFDRSFLKLSPTLAVITTIEAEHLDTYSDIEGIKDAFVEFANRVPFYGSVIVCGDDLHAREILPRIKRQTLTYGRADADFLITDERQEGLHSSFRLRTPDGESFEIQLQVPGAHNVLNATAAAALAIELDIAPAVIRSALGDFAGVHRRFELKGEMGGVRIFDDYAHHPTEVRVSLETARKCWPDNRLIALFQPHLYSRTRDFAADFASALSIADMILLLDIYGSRERPIEGVTSNLIAELLLSSGKSVNCVTGPDRLKSRVREYLKPGDVVLAMGAGSITHLADELARP
jgi:UDP-N-acetylmuramate--alanine ligase